MNILSKKSLKNVVGGFTPVELLIVFLQGHGFEDNVLASLLFWGNNTPDGTSITNLEFLPDNPMANEIVGIKLVKIEASNGDKLLITEKNIKIV